MAQQISLWPDVGPVIENISITRGVSAHDVFALGFIMLSSFDTYCLCWLQMLFFYLHMFHEFTLGCAPGHFSLKSLKRVTGLVRIPLRYFTVLVANRGSYVVEDLSDCWRL